MSEKLKAVLTAIDAINQQDPTKRELPYSERLTAWVLKLNPQASEELQIAARGQHIARWKTPREQYPEGRGGYLRWREDLKKFHAHEVGEIMKQKSYSQDSIDRVQSLILKKDIKGNDETQTLEDGLCLVFLETQFNDLRSKTPVDKMQEIVRKTWKKMSSQGQESALALPLSGDDINFILASLKLS